jgi:hypothetical protein
MTWEQYEVWAEDDLAREILVDTTKSRKEALGLGKKAMHEGAVAVKIFRETVDGAYDLIEEIRS